jgi:iron only hydrogenase large subunit-like protein
MVEKYHPDLVQNLAPIFLRLLQPPKLFIRNTAPCKIVLIGPCIQSKEETKLYKGDSQIDENLTFVELRELFDEFNIKESNFEFSEFDEPIGYKGSLFPLVVEFCRRLILAKTYSPVLLLVLMPR